MKIPSPLEGEGKGEGEDPVADHALEMIYEVYTPYGPPWQGGRNAGGVRRSWHKRRSWGKTVHNIQSPLL
jgi:hypothetical protein